MTSVKSKQAIFFDDQLDLLISKTANELRNISIGILDFLDIRFSFQLFKQ